MLVSTVGGGPVGVRRARTGSWLVELGLGVSVARVDDWPSAAVEGDDAGEAAGARVSVCWEHASASNSDSPTTRARPRRWSARPKRPMPPSRPPRTTRWGLVFGCMSLDASRPPILGSVDVPQTVISRAGGKNYVSLSCSLSISVCQVRCATFHRGSGSEASRRPYLGAIRHVEASVEP